MEQFKRIDKIHYLYEVNDVLPDERKVDAVGGGGDNKHCSVYYNEYDSEYACILNKKAKKLALLKIFWLIIYKCTHWPIFKKYKNKRNKCRR